MFCMVEPGFLITCHENIVAKFAKVCGGLGIRVTMSKCNFFAHRIVYTIIKTDIPHEFYSNAKVFCDEFGHQSTEIGIILFSKLIEDQLKTEGLQKLLQLLSFLRLMFIQYMKDVRQEICCYLFIS